MKQYRPTLVYIIKIFGLIIGAAFSIFIISLFINIISFFVESSLFEKIILILLTALFITAIFLIIRSNNPSISFKNDSLLIGRQEISFDQIEKFHPSKGGSEPYIVTKDGLKIDIETSWFRKKDRLEIEQIIVEKIQLFIKQV